MKSKAPAGPLKIEMEPNRSAIELTGHPSLHFVKSRQLQVAMRSLFHTESEHATTIMPAIELR